MNAGSALQHKGLQGTQADRGRGHLKGQNHERQTHNNAQTDQGSGYEKKSHVLRMERIQDSSGVHFSDVGTGNNAPHRKGPV